MKLIRAQQGSPRFLKSKSKRFLNIKLQISQVHVKLMNDFDKTFVLVFYFSFLKIKLNCDILNTEDVV